MTTFPDEVLTRTKKGEIEVRSLIDRGRYVRYSYLHTIRSRKLSARARPCSSDEIDAEIRQGACPQTNASRSPRIPSNRKGMRRADARRELNDFRWPSRVGTRGGTASLRRGSRRESRRLRQSCRAALRNRSG